MRRILPILCVLSFYTTYAEQPMLYFGANLGTALTAVYPSGTIAKGTSITQLTLNLGGVDNPADYNEEAYLETSDVLQDQIQITPSVGMLFPIGTFIVIDGNASVDFTEREYVVKNRTDQANILALINRDVGIQGSLQAKISRQYSIGPAFEGHIIKSKSDVVSGTGEKEYSIFMGGIKSIYRFHQYMSVSMSLISAIDQKFTVKNLKTTDATISDLGLDYHQTKIALTFMISPF